MASKLLFTFESQCLRVSRRWKLHRSYGSLTRSTYQSQFIMNNSTRVKEQILGTKSIIGSFHKVPVTHHCSHLSTVTEVISNYNHDISPENPITTLATSSSSSSSSIMDLSWYNPSHQVINFVHQIHDVTGGSYAVSIALATISMRLFIILPLELLSRKERVKFELIKQRHKQLSATQKKFDRKSLYSLYGYNPKLIILAPLSSVVLLFTMIYGLNRVPQSTTEFMGGLLWCADLTQPDPIRFLPIFSATTLFLMGEVGADTSGRQPKYIWLWRGIRIAIFPLTLDMPASVFCFWIPNNLFSLFQTAYLNQSNLKNKWWDEILLSVSKKQNHNMTYDPSVNIDKQNSSNSKSISNHPKQEQTIQFISMNKNKKIKSSKKNQKRKRKK